MNKMPWRGFWLLMRADKPIGNYLLLWPTLWGLWFAAEGLPSLHILLVFVAGVYLMRAAGCVINDYADRHIDGNIKRTNARPLVTGLVTERQALTLFVALLLVAFSLVLTLNKGTVLLSFIAVLLASCYPFMKRFTYLPQFVLGAAFSWSIPMAFMAVTQQLPNWLWWIYVANLLWTVAYDTQYAMVDRDDDLKVGVKSTAILFGRWDRGIIAGLQLLTLVVLLYLGWLRGLSWLYWCGLTVAAGLFVYQQKLIWLRQREQCFAAFLNNNYAGMAITLGIIAEFGF